MVLLTMWRFSFMGIKGGKRRSYIWYWDGEERLYILFMHFLVVLLKFGG